jgi:CDP-diacylglycerol pyrophosphatase
LKLTKKALVYAMALVGAIGAAAAADRTLLWSVVQVCVTNHQLTGASFPCLAVDTSRGIENGFATIRAPLENTHIIVSPTAKIEGIEDPALQSSGAPNFFYDAWEARDYVKRAASRTINDRDIGLAINSRPGRTQDQLHIHVDCLEQTYADELRRHDSEINEKKWTRLQFPLRSRYYWGMRLKPDLKEVNVFALAATLLRVSPGHMEDMTLVVIPRASDAGMDGFNLLAGQYTPRGRGGGHGEFLLDHSCAAH